MKLKWKFEKGIGDFADEWRTEEGFEIAKLPQTSEGRIFHLDRGQTQIGRFRKLSVAKQVAQLIHNG